MSAAEWQKLVDQFPADAVPPLAAVVSDELASTQNDLLVAIGVIRDMRAEIEQLADWFWDNNLPHFADKVRAVNGGQR